MLVTKELKQAAAKAERAVVKLSWNGELAEGTEWHTELKLARRNPRHEYNSLDAEPEDLQASFQSTEKARLSDLRRYGEHPTDYDPEPINSAVIHLWNVQNLACVIALAPVGSSITFEIHADNSCEMWKQLGLVADDLWVRVDNAKGVCKGKVQILEDLRPAGTTCHRVVYNGAPGWQRGI